MPDTHFIATPYAITSAISAFLSLSVALITGPKLRRNGGNYISLLLYSLAIWSGFAGLEYAATDLVVKFTFVQLQYIGVVSTPVLFLLSALELSQRSRWLQPKRVALLFAIPAITLLLAFTNPAHHLLWTSIQLDTVHNTSVLGHGPWYWVGSVGYSYLVISISSIILLRSALSFLQPYRSQVVLLILSALIPVVGNLLYIFNLTGAPGYDPTASLISISAILFAINVYRYRMMEIPPLELGQVLDSLPQSVIVTDAFDRLIYLNHSAAALLGQAGENLMPKPVPIPPHPGQVIELLPQYQSDFFSFKLQAANGTRHFHGQRSALLGKTHRGYIWLISDDTIEYEASMLRQQAMLDRERDTLLKQLDGDLAALLGSMYTNLSRVQQDMLQGNQSAALTQLDTLLVAANNADRDLRLAMFNILARGQAGDGISSLLQEYTRRVTEITGLSVSISLPDNSLDGILSTENAGTLMATLQELLNHAVTTGNATHAYVMLTLQNNLVSCVYTDDSAIGHPNLAETLQTRASSSGAVVDLRHQPGSTQMLLTVPASTQRQRPISQLVKVRLLMADQQTLFADTLMQTLGNHGAIVLGNITNPALVATHAAKNQAEIVLLSSRWPTARLRQLLSELASQAPNAKLVVLGDEYSDEMLRACVQDGVEGILLKDQPLPEVLAALSAIHQGSPAYAPAISPRLAGLVMQPGPSTHQQAIRTLLSAGLSEKQIGVLQGVANGKVYKEIANELSLSESAIKYHMERMLELTGIESRGRLIQYAYQIGLVEERRK